MNIIDFILFLCIIFWGVFGIRYVFKNSNRLSEKEVKLLQRLYLVHLFVSLFFSNYIANNGGDANAYWYKNGRFSTDVEWSVYFRTGTSFILFLTYPLVKYLQLSFYTGGLLFGVIGFNGFIYFYCIIRKFIKKPIKLYSLSVFPLILYMPNMHFWSSGTGKDSLTLCAIMLFYYCAFDLNRKWIWMIAALVLTFFIRPHITLFLVVSSFAAIVIDRKMKASIKVFLAVIMIVAGIFLFNTVLSYLRLEEISTETVSEFSEERTSSLQKGAGSAVDISGYPLPLKVFTLLYRPLFFDINSVLAVVSSFENLILLWLTVLMFKKRPFAAFKAAPMPIKSMLIFGFICALAFSLTLSNLGIMLRQKNPVIFCLLIFIFWCLAYDRHLKLKRRQALINRAIANKPLGSE